MCFACQGLPLVTWKAIGSQRWSMLDTEAAHSQRLGAGGACCNQEPPWSSQPGASCLGCKCWVVLAVDGRWLLSILLYWIILLIFYSSSGLILALSTFSLYCSYLFLPEKDHSCPVVDSFWPFSMCSQSYLFHSFRLTLRYLGSLGDVMW